MEYHFQTAIRGFKREEVVAYIEYITKQHRAEVNQLTADLEYEKQHKEVSDAADVSGVLAEKQELCDSLQTQLSEREKEAEELTQRLSQAEAALEEKTAALEQQEKALAEKTAAFETLEELLQEQEEGLKEQEARLQNITALQERIDTLEDTLSQKEAALSQREESLAEANRTVDTQKITISDLEDRVSQQQRTIAENTVDTSEPSRVYSAQNSCDDESDRLLAEKDKTIAELREKLRKWEQTGSGIHLEHRAGLRAVRINQESDRIVLQTAQTLEEASSQVDSAVHQMMDKLEALQLALKDSREKIQSIGLEEEDA